MSAAERLNEAGLNIAVTTPSRSARSRRPREPGASRNQLAKSDAMRTQILETVIDCLATRPYSEVSAALVAKQAGVSRGGLQYHFPTWLALMRSAVEFLHTRRLDLFRTDLSALPEGANVIDHVIDTHWRHLNEREFRAYQEMVLAARSQPELAALLASQYSAFLHEWHEIARTTFKWNYTDPDVARAGNIAHYILEGMAYGNLGGQLGAAEIDQLLAYTKQVLRDQTGS